MDSNSSSVRAPRALSVKALRRSITVVVTIAACLGASVVVGVFTAWTNPRPSSLPPIETGDRKGLKDAQQSPDVSATEKVGPDAPYADSPTPFRAVSIGEVFARAPR